MTSEEEHRELRRIGHHVNQLADKIHSALDEDLRELAVNATIAWVAGKTAEEWAGQARATPAEIEHLKDAECWPWVIRQPRYPD